MPKKIWNSENFADWKSRHGLSYARAAEILDVNISTVKRIISRQSAVKDTLTEKALAFEAMRVLTQGVDGEAVDDAATMSDIATLCEALPVSFITAQTSAILRGWTSANMNGRRHVSATARTERPPAAAGATLVWHTAESDWGVESRKDNDGRFYRIAGIERTLFDLVCDEYNLGEDEIAEAFQGAFELSEQRPNVAQLLRKAEDAGPTVSELMFYFIKKYF